MRRIGLPVLLVLIALLVGCDGDDTADAGAIPDVMVDGAPDVTIDMEMVTDLAVDMDPEPADAEIVTDMGPDVTIDLAIDLALPDVGPDAELDQAVDAEMDQAVDAEVEPDQTVDAEVEPDQEIDAEVELDQTVDAEVEPDQAVDAEVEPDVEPVDAAPACGPERPCPDDLNCVRGQCIAGECRGAEDCPPDAVCIGQTCVPGDCVGDDDCADGQLCLFNRCTAGCRRDADCGDGRCVANVCVECAADADCPDGLCDGGGVCAPGDCRDDFDCAPGALCLDRICTPGDCREDADCGARSRCFDNRCVLDGCEGDADCPDGLCLDGACVPGDCRGDGDCADGVPCVANRCAVNCALDADCGPGALCQSEVCVAGDCRGDRDCDPGDLCIDDRCTTAECRGDGDCAPGSLCVDRACVATDCRQDADCPVDGAQCLRGRCVVGECLEDGDCAEGRCLRGTCTVDACLADRDCAAGAACLDGSCVDGGCRDDFGCDPGALCIDARCIEGQCRGDDDCPDGSLCRGFACVVGDCVDDGDCDPGVPCLNGACTPNGCRADADCGDGRLCERDRCVDGDCRVDPDCGEGQSCVRATCVVGDCIDDGDCADAPCLGGVCTPGGCRADADCDAGSLCFAGLCAVADCRVDGDCGVRQTCIDRTCVAGECLADDDCALGELCLDERCTLADCRDAGGCLDGQSCVQRRCIDGDCLDDGDCDGASLCVDGECTPGDCRTDLECGAFAICIEARCTPGDCRIDGDCGPDALCVERFCTPADCRIDDDCDNGLRCDGGFCVDDPLFAGCAAAVAWPEGAVGAIDDIAVQQGSCGGGGPERVVRYTFADARPVCGALLSGPPSAVLYARTTCAEPETEIGCAPPAAVRAGVTVQGEAGQTVYLSVDVDPGDSGPFEVAFTDGACPDPCVVDGDCGALELCLDTLCVEAPVCAADATCPEGRLCIAGRCQPPQCAEDADCGEVELCIEQRCVPGNCRADEDCPQGICTDRLCQPDGCRDDGDCADGICLDELCIPGGCRNDAECPEGICVTLRCVEDGCRDDAGCAEGELCLDYGCRVANCRVDADCPDQMCEDDLCVDRQCDLDNGVPCGVGETCTDFRCADTIPRFGTCEDPVALPVPTPIPGDLNFARPTTVGSCGGDGPDSVYHLAPAASGTYCVFMPAGDFDAILYARSACANTNTQLDCSDDDPFAGAQRGAIEVEIGGEGPEEVYVYVDGATRFDFGPFTVRAVAGPCGGPEPCADDADCAFDGEVCVEGVCGTVECRRDIECGDGRTCRDFECVAPECISNAECPADAFGPRRCVDFVCTRAADIGTCDAPLPVLPGQPVLGSTENAPSALEASCAGRAASREQVFLFVPERDGPHCATTAGSDFDTAVHVRTDCAEAGTEIACDDNGAGLQSSVTFAGVAEEPVSVIVDGYGQGNVGAYVLTVTRGACGERPACAVDDDCLAGEACVRGGCDPDPCRVAPAIEDGQTVEVDTRGAPERIVPDCGTRPSGPELLFRYEAAEDGPVCFDTAGSDMDTVLSIRGVDACLDDERACADDDGPRADRRGRLTFETEAGAAYLVAIDGAGGDRGRATLSVRRGPCALDAAECADDVDCADGVCVDKRCAAPAADACAAPIPLALGESVEGDTTDAATDFGARCGDGAEGPEQVYAFTVDAAGPVCARVEAAHDTVLHVRDGGCRASSREVGCNDDAPGGLQSALTIEAAPGRTYHLFVDGYGFDRGAYTVSLEPGRCAPCADEPECVDAAAGTCAAPVVLDEVIGTHRSTTVGAADALSAGCSDLRSGPETVFAFTAPADGPLCLTTAGSGIDTVLSVRGADCAAELDCNDDAPRLVGEWASALTLDARAGVDYRVVVDGVDGVVGAVALTIAEGKCSPPSFSGIRRQMTLDALDELGLEQCFVGLYDAQTPLDDLLAACDRPTLLLGCRPVGEENLTLAAMGERDAVLSTPDGPRAATAHNGSAWYFDPDGGWGFAAADAEVDRAPCDLEPGDDRLCWHTLDGQLSSGYRCGDVFLNGSNRWERLVFQRTEGLRP